MKEAGLKSNYRDTSISMWENGNRSPQGISEMKVLANMLGKSLDELCRNVSPVKNDESLAQGKSQEKSPEESGDENQQNQSLSVSVTEKERSFSFEIAMFIAGDSKIERVYDDAQDVNEKTQITVASEYWTFQPLEIDVENSNGDEGNIHLYEYHDLIAIKKTVESAQLVDEKTFRRLMCEYIASNTDVFAGKADWVEEYINWRFTDSALGYSECFLPEDLEDNFGDISDFEVSGKVIAKYYTTKGVLFRYRCAVEMNLDAYAQILFDYEDEIDNDVRKFNKTKVEELF
ncbi:MAG: helix-turn-helix domain-containing protein [Christensenellales bacterium]